jgi:putative acetyltransferase
MNGHRTSDIRDLSAADVPAVLRVISDVRKEYGLQRRVGNIIEPSDRNLSSTYQRQRSRYFVALDGTRVVGGAGIGPLGDANGPICELQRMYLRPECRRSGIGSRLLDRCLAAARSFGYEQCYAETVSEMKEAVAFYRAHGFRTLTGPIGDTGHRHNDSWLILDLT